MRMKGEDFERLIEDLEGAVEDLGDLLRRDRALWSRARPGKWTAGQHADHVAVALAATAASFEANEARLREGALPQRPFRDPLQWTFVLVAVGAGKLPRGGRTPRAMYPAARPVAADVLTRLARDVERHRRIGERLAPRERDRLWIENPFMKGWHYSLPEILRVHAVHVRHHGRQIEELAEPGAGAR